MRQILKCRSCGADIYWIETQAGKKHPIDAKPKKVWVNKIIVGAEGQEHKDTEKWMLVDGYASHFGTCPQSKPWSNKGEREVFDIPTKFL